MLHRSFGALPPTPGLPGKNVVSDPMLVNQLSAPEHVETKVFCLKVTSVELLGGKDKTLPESIGFRGLRFGVSNPDSVMY